MKTKCIVIGEEAPKNEAKGIEFIRQLFHITNKNHLEIVNALDYPNDWQFIELICKNYVNNVDLMFAYNDPNKRHLGSLYIGRWNDGVVC